MLIIGLAGLTSFFYFQKTQKNTNFHFPKRHEEFKIQGLMWRSIAYYYNPSIYSEIYNPSANERLVKKAKNVGANYLLIRAFYSGTEEGKLIGDDRKAEESLRKAIEIAHNYDIKIFLSPFIESMEFWPKRKWNLDVEKWTEKVLKWARFAQENNVELFAPGFEMAIIMDKEEAKKWFKTILPEIRKVYKGKITFAEIPYGEQWEFIEKDNVFEGYDCVGITIFPWKDYDGEHDLRSFEDLKQHTQKQVELLNDLGEKYNTDCRIVATLGMDYWYGKEPSPEIRAQGYNLSLDVLKEYNVTGVFLHLWASEHDQLGESREVEEMLKTRWIESEK